MAEIACAVELGTSGTPVVAGTDVPVVLVLERVADGRAVGDVATEYGLTAEQVRGAFAYGVLAVRRYRAVEMVEAAKSAAATAELAIGRLQDAQPVVDAAVAWYGSLQTSETGEQHVHVARALREAVREYMRLHGSAS